MLSREEAICDYDVHKLTVHPHRLSRTHQLHYIGYAERMLDLYRQGIGRRRRDLHRDVEAVFAEEECHSRCIKAFQKLLDLASHFKKGRAEVRELRHAVFGRAARQHPLARTSQRLYGHDEGEVKATIAGELRRSWEEIDDELFSDLHDFRRLQRFEGYTDAPALLSRYNVAQTQAALYDAIEMRVRTGDRTDLKLLVRQIKWSGLVHGVERRRDNKPGYEFVFDGPASVHEHTRRYGVNMARFLPVLLACEDWEMDATMRKPGDKKRLFRLHLSPANRLRGFMNSSQEFDSKVEEAFFKRWGGEEKERDGWRLRREGTVLERHQHLFTPDFTLTHGQSGRTVSFEIVGYWRDAYLKHKLETLERFGDKNIVWAVRANLYKEFCIRGAVCFPFKGSVKLEPLLDCLRMTDHPPHGEPSLTRT